jgi:hypothetical protein
LGAVVTRDVALRQIRSLPELQRSARRSRHLRHGVRKQPAHAPHPG